MGNWAAFCCFVVALLLAAPAVHADIVTDANTRAAETVSRLPSPPVTVRMMAIVQVSVFESVNARPSAVAVLPPGTLPKTPSGKVRRAAAGAQLAEHLRAPE